MDNYKPEPWRIWELIPVKFYDVDNLRLTSAHRIAGPGDGDFETTVIEVTTVTTIKKYQRRQSCTMFCFLFSSLFLVLSVGFVLL